MQLVLFEVLWLGIILLVAWLAIRNARRERADRSTADLRLGMPFIVDPIRVMLRE